MHNTHTFHALICELAGQHSTELSAKAEIQILPKAGDSDRQRTEVGTKWKVSDRNKFLQTSEKQAPRINDANYTKALKITFIYQICARVEVR